jgi:hypothetical protein
MADEKKELKIDDLSEKQGAVEEETAKAVKGGIYTGGLGGRLGLTTGTTISSPDGNESAGEGSGADPATSIKL